MLPMANTPLAILSVSSENQSYLPIRVSPIVMPGAEPQTCQGRNPRRQIPSLNPVTKLLILSKCKIPILKTLNFTRRSQPPDLRPWTTRSIQPQHSLLRICVLSECGKSTLMLPCPITRTPEAAAKSHVRQKVLIQDRDHLRSCTSSRRRSQLRLQTLNLDFRA